MKYWNLVKYRNFGPNFGLQRLKFLVKIEILIKNKKCGQKIKIFAKIEILIKKQKNGQKIEIFAKIEILAKSRNFL